MSNSLAHMGKTAPVMMKNCIMANHLIVSSKISKKLVFLNAKQDANTSATASFAKDWNKALFHKDEFSLLYTPRFRIFGCRFCTTNAPDKSPSSNRPSTSPTIVNQKQIEQMFFRTVAFIWDKGVIVIEWSRDVLKTFVVDNPSVQYYWKRFHENMEKAKKNDR